MNATRLLTDAVDANPSTIRRLLHATRPTTAEAIALAEAYGQAPPTEVCAAMAQIEANEGTENFTVPLDGFEVAELIEKQGPAVGATLDRLMEDRLDSGPLTKEKATALVLDWKISGE